jgi:hypothetical protein
LGTGWARRSRKVLQGPAARRLIAVILFCAPLLCGFTTLSERLMAIAPAASGGSGVTFDAQGTWAGANTNSLTYTGMTIVAGNALIAYIVLNDPTPSDTISSVTWNGVAMTQLAFSQNGITGGSVWAYGLRNPASGNKNLVVTLG